MNYSDKLRENVENSIETKKKFLSLSESIDLFGRATKAVVDAYRNGGRLYIAGNGGSAADAQHLAAEFVSKLAVSRAPLPAEALTVDTSIITAIANDYGYEEIFSRQVAGKMKSGDVFLGITTSGNSSNINHALRQCKKQGNLTIVFAGRDGGGAKDLADYCIIASGEHTANIQELHIVLAHTLCEIVEYEMFAH